jgi:hypothetical protein
MTTIIIAALATACILTAVESLIIALGKWRGLLALGASVGSLVTLTTPWAYLPVYGLATAFLGLVLSLAVEQLFAGIDAKELPRRIPMR